MNPPDPYAKRLWQLTLVRLAGVALAFLGMVLGASDRLGPPQPALGSALVVVGLLGGLLAGRWLRRRWRDLPPPQ